MALIRQSIWLSAASEFNDLHDTSVVVDMHRGAQSLMRDRAAMGFSGLPGEIAKRLSESAEPLTALDEIFVSELEKQSGPEMASKAKGFFSKLLATISEQTTSNITRVFQRGTKVACFCEEYDSATLWGYYAQSHEGFCVEYPVDHLPHDDLRIRWLWPVVYSAKRFELVTLMELLKGRPNPFMATLASVHKAPGWAHEREWRIVLPSGDDSAGQEISMAKPTRIFLGSRMSADYKRKVVAIADSQDIPVFEMFASTGGDFGLHAVPLARP